MSAHYCCVLSGYLSAWYIAFAQQIFLKCIIAQVIRQNSDVSLCSLNIGEKIYEIVPTKELTSKQTDFCLHICNIHSSESTTIMGCQ